MKKAKKHQIFIDCKQSGSFTAISTILTALSLVSWSASAAEINVGNPEIEIHWDNTLKYSAGIRLKSQSKKLVSDPASPNEDDGDRNFNTGLISNRADLLSELDVSYHNWGVRFSGAAWGDTEYLGKNDNSSPLTTNHPSTSFDHFAGATERQQGRHLELLDAFGFGETNIGDSSLTFRLGRHTVLWGETVFYGNNGIAGGQSPVDIAKLISVPGTQFKELIRPINQISAQFQINQKLTVAGYYQLQWEPDVFPAAGSYFSTSDFFGKGDETFLLGPVNNVPGLVLGHKHDMNARDQGQGGISLRLSTEDADYGLYAINYHEKSPQLYLNFNPFIFNRFASAFVPNGGNFQWVYPENIQAYGASVSTTVDNYNIAAEISTRQHSDLVSNPISSLPFNPVSGDNNHNALYAVGNTLHANISILATLPPNFLARESTLVAEIAANRVYAVTKNESALGTYTDRNALGGRLVYTPSYRQIFPSVDLSFPIGISFSPLGRSAAVAGFGVNHGGDMSIGVEGSYLDVWRFGMTYTHFYGPAGVANDVNGAFTFNQSLADRDFISFNLRRTF